MLDTISISESVAILNIQDKACGLIVGSFNGAITLLETDFVSTEEYSLGAKKKYTVKKQIHVPEALGQPCRIVLNQNESLMVIVTSCKAVLGLDSFENEKQKVSLRLVLFISLPPTVNPIIMGQLHQ